MVRPNKIDFKNIALRNGSQPNAFEEFCCQIARHSADVPDGSEFIRYRGEGGDGGVECIWRLPNGDEWGWQAKFMFNMTQAKAALDDSVATAISLHPRLTRYTICLPFDLTGPTARKGKKSQTEYFDSYREAWESAARSKGVEMQVVVLTPSALLDNLLTFDKNQGRLSYWFDTTSLGDEWFKNHLIDVKASAYPRYTPELSIQTPLGEALEALGLTDEWFASLYPHLKKFREILVDWERSVSSTEDHVWHAAFPDDIRPDGERARGLLVAICDSYGQLAESQDITIDLSALAAKTAEALRLFREIRAALAADLEAKHGEGTADSKGFRQFQAEYQVSFPAANLDTADEVIQFLESFDAWVTSSPARLPSVSNLLVLGLAGVGKTHGICDVAERRTLRGLRTIVLFGERFSGVVEPWESIRQQLGLAATLGRDAMLASLDAAGEATGKPILLCIDGLNETKPRTYWPAHLPSMVAQLSHYNWIRLCISCRSTYERQVIPGALGLPVVVHEGFSGIEFDASREFFAYYGLEPPVAPVLQPEFSNPLFLRLICEAMVDAGLKQLPLGWQGIGTAINAFVQAKNQRYAAEHDVHPSHRYPEQALKALVSAAQKAKASSLRWSVASGAIDAVLPPARTPGSLLDWLIREGLLIVDADPDPLSPAPEDYVRIAFERLGDHLLANKLLENLDASNIKSAFDEGPLAFLVADLDSLNEHRGLVEALSIQLPERFGLELPDCADRPDLRNDLIEVVVQALPWRDPKHVTERTGGLLKRSLSFASFVRTAFDISLSVSGRPSPVDAFWLHRQLANRAMPDRDAFWCGYLYQNYEEKGPVEKLIRAAFALEPTQVPLETVERWATVLLWFCAAADRRVRDHSTNALVRITESRPIVWRQLIDRFMDIDDDYVLERCLLAAYGCLLRSRDPLAETAVAEAVYREVFADSSRFQNALIRDHARSILELAHFDKALPDGITEAEYLPPYESEWPLTIPTAEEVEQYHFANKEMPRLYHSCMADDFFRYTLGLVDGYQCGIERAGMGRWIFQQVLDMGYTEKRFANYDGHMLYKHGGGRGRPTWAERIGKKYQWIALARLTARLADHVEIKYDDWDPKPLRTPLVYESGRDIDPSLLTRTTLMEKKKSAWWIAERYNFDAVSTMTHEEWVKVYEEMPNTQKLLAEQTDAKGRRWIVLQAYPEWTSRAPDAPQSEAYRLVWLYIHSYLVPRVESKRCWKWLQKQNFFGDWMPQGAEFHGGFIGEYPFATSFNVYKDAYLSRGGVGEKRPPCETYPTCNSLNVSHEEDAYQEGSIHFLLPARRFFEQVSLKWNGASGYMSAEGQLRFLDPSVIEPGPSSLLIESDFLQDFLNKNDLDIFWTVVGEKLRIIESSWPRLVYSRAHMLTTKGLLSSKPIITGD